MTPRDRSALAESLEMARWAKVEEAANLASRLRTIDSEKDPEIEGRAQEESTASLLRRLGDRDHEAIAAIEEALQRVADGTYGICEECGEDIPVARLRAVPTARLCVDCKGEQERARRLRANAEPTAFNARILDPLPEVEEELA